MQYSTVTTKGQVTIPAIYRKELNIKEGNVVEFKLINGQLIVEPKANDVTQVFGLLKSKKSVSLEEMEKAIEKGRSSRWKA
jgi:antitoxin PrlF